MAAKKKEKAKVATAKKEVKSSMQFIRETVTAKPDIEFEALVKAIRKAGYETKESSIKQEFLKTLRKIGKPRPKRPVEKKAEGKGKGAKAKATKAKQKPKAKGKGGEAEEDESCSGVTMEEPVQ